MTCNERSLKMVDLNETVGEMQRIFQSVVGDKVAFRSTLDPAVGSIAGEKRAVTAFLVNLFMAARDATPAGGELWVSTSPIELNDANAGEWNLPAGRYVQLSIETGREVQLRKMDDVLAELGAAMLARQVSDRFVLAIAFPGYSSLLPV